MKRKITGCILLAASVLWMSGCATGQISNEYVTITKYKNVEVPKVEGLPEITEDSVNNNIDKVLDGLSQKKEVKGKAVEKGDIIVMDYTASVDGKKIDGVGVTDYELEIGADSYFKGFEDSMIGHKAGDTYEIKHTFPADYKDAKVAGKNVTFNIKVKSVNKKVSPDLTDELVKTISEKSKTVDEYKKEVKALLEENNKQYVIKELTDSSWQQVLDNSEIKEYPKDQLEKEKQTFYDNIDKGAETYKMDRESFLKEMGMTQEEFEEKAAEASKANVKENVVAELIAEKQDIKLTDKEYEKAKKELAKEMGFENVEEMEKEAPEGYIKSYILRDEVKNWVAARCLQVNNSKE